jgi:hypothetical protein
VHIETITRANQLPARPVDHPLGEEVVPTPQVTELNLITPKSDVPAEVPIINEAQPDLLQQLTPRPLDVIKNRVVTLHPK